MSPTYMILYVLAHDYWIINKIVCNPENIPGFMEGRLKIFTDTIPLSRDITKTKYMSLVFAVPTFITFGLIYWKYILPAV